MLTGSGSACLTSDKGKDRPGHLIICSGSPLHDRSMVAVGDYVDLDLPLLGLDGLAECLGLFAQSAEFLVGIEYQKRWEFAGDVRHRRGSLAVLFVAETSRHSVAVHVKHATDRNDA